MAMSSILLPVGARVALVGRRVRRMVAPPCNRRHHYVLTSRVPLTIDAHGRQSRVHATSGE